MNIKNYLLLFILSIIFQTSKGNNQQVFTIEDYVFEDTTGNISFKEILSDSIRFQPANPKNTYISNLNSVYWIKFKISSSENNKNYLLSLDPRYTFVEFYTPEKNGKFKVTRKGLSSNATLSTFNRRIFFNLPHSYNNSSSIYYLKIKSNFKTGLGFLLSENISTINVISRDYLFYGLFLGVVGIVLFYNINLFFSIREKVYLYYALYVFNFGIFALVHYNFIIPIIKIFSSKWHWEFYTIPYAFMTIFLLLYTRSFLITKEKLPLIDKILLSLIYIRVVFLITSLLIEINFLITPEIDNIFHFIAFITGLVRLRQGFKPAFFFSLAFSFLFIGLIAHGWGYLFLNTNSFILENDNVLYLAGIAEISLFSLALSNRFKTLKDEKEKAQGTIIKQLREKEEHLTEKATLNLLVIEHLKINEALKEKVNRELEEKVKDRTEQIRTQALEIERMNRLLQKENQELELNVKDLSNARVMQKEVSFEEFMKIYPDEETCLNFLASLKWSQGFICKKCSNTNYNTIKNKYSRRCTTCRTISSPTSDTIFHKLKFPLLKAFYLLFLTSSGKELTADELSKLVSLRRETCWMFRKKVLDAIKDKKHYKKKADGWQQLIVPRD